jgi:hypothetical protein
MQAIVIAPIPNENMPPLKSSQPAVDIPGFFDAVEQALNLFIKTEGTPDNTKPTLVHEFPKERLAKPDDVFDVITFKVAKSEMAPTLNDGSKPRNPTSREVKPHPELAGFNVQTFGWWELVKAEFSVWSKSNANADIVTAWFHDFMVKYAFLYKFFLARGVQNFRFVDRADDDIDLYFGQELYRRRLTYEFRLETLFSVEQKQLTDLDINYGVSSPSDSINIRPSQ